MVITLIAIGPIAFTIDILGTSFAKKSNHGGGPLKSGASTMLSKQETKPNPLRRLPMYSYNLMRSLLMQGNTLPVNSLAVSVLFMVWYFFCLLMYGKCAIDISYFDQFGIACFLLGIREHFDFVLIVSVFVVPAFQTLTGKVF